MIRIDGIDHLVLTVRDPRATCEFYGYVPGAEIVTFGEARKALRFGAQKINLHTTGAEWVPHALHPKPGAGDLCLITRTPLEVVGAEPDA